MHKASRLSLQRVSSLRNIFSLRSLLREWSGLFNVASEQPGSYERRNNERALDLNTRPGFEPETQWSEVKNVLPLDQAHRARWAV